MKKITLNVRVESGRAQLEAIRRKVPGSKVSKGSLTKSIATSEPEEAIEVLKNLVETIRNVEKNPEGFK